MKLALLIFIVPQLCFAALPDQEFLGSRITQFENVSYDFRITKDALQKAPKWNSEAAFPPLSPKQAQTIASTQLAKLIPEQKQWMHIQMIYLEVLYDTDWIYMVTFDYVPPSAYSGPPRLFTIPVYLDGAIITPKIHKNKK